MGRTNSNPVQKMYFKYNLSTNESVCQITDCTNPVRTGHHSGNLENHIKNFHKVQYNLLLKEKEKRNDKDYSSTSTKKLKVSTLDNLVVITKKSLNNVLLNKQKIIDACVQMVTINGRPFTMLEDSGFKMIMDPLMDAIGGGFRINSRNIIQYVRDYSDTIIQTIKLDIRNRLISLKVDCVTRLNRSIIGVNIQYIKDGQLNIKTLGMTELFQRHTSEYLHEVLISILRKYNIGNRQVYSITCDNGANIVKMARLFNDSIDFNEEESILYEENERETTDINDDHQHISETEVLQMMDNVGIEFNAENLQQEIFTALEEETCSPLTECVRCSVHTFQLCVDQGLKENSIQFLLTKARKVVKVLRTQSYAALLKKENLKQAVIDIVTRWRSSTYLMLVRLNELKHFCIDHDKINTDLFLKPQQWDKINSMINSLEPAYLATKMLQKSDLTLGDFYGIWEQTKSKFSQIKSVLSKSITIAMIARQEQLMNNNIFISAIYLDPRFMCTLSAENKKNAIDHLLKTWTLKSSLISIDAIAETIHPGLISKPTNIKDLLDDENVDISDEFEEFLKNCSQTSAQSNDSLNSSTPSPLNLIKLKLEDFGKLERLSYKEDVVKFWENNKKEMPELFELAQIVMAVPATQVSVERSFSGLKFILSDQRNSISGNLLEDILIIRGNQQQFKI